jgi:predicted nuclease of predicted toxin-antitoxin system
VKFLVDNQLPKVLAEYLRTRGFDCQHVLDVGLAEVSDAEVCRYARVQERIIISKDEDFLYFANQPESKIRLVWVRLGNCRTSTLLMTFEKLWPMIESCLSAGDRVIEIR